MTGPVHALLAEDHARLDALLLRATERADRIDRDAYEQFRAGLLRHIAMEEKVLLKEAQRARGGTPLEAAKQLRADHGALAALLVPTPTHEILETIKRVLAEHNPLEEGRDGVYAQCERLVGLDAGALVERLRAVPQVPLAAHVDGPRVHEHIANLLRARTKVGRDPSP